MDMLMWCFVFTLLCLVTIKGVNGSCYLDLENDFAMPSPVFLLNGRYLEPNDAGGISLDYLSRITIACPGQKNLVLNDNITEMQDIEVTCLYNSTFQIDRFEILDMKYFKCAAAPWISSEEVANCHGGNRLYRVGYRIRNVLFPLYEACYDRELVSTLYVHHRLAPSARFTQKRQRRPQFIEGGLFGKISMTELYKNKRQRERLDYLLGPDMSDQYITKTQFLTRGHLAPKADFPMIYMQRATFHYVNTSPQWMRGNAGDWAALEDAVRRRAFKLNRTLEVYTGTYDVLELLSDMGENREIYLDDDENNNPIVPVPMYFFKVVHDPTEKTATAFISINSSFFNRTTTDWLTFCRDICDSNKNFAWLKWRPDGGHSFCCSYDAFVEKIDYLPKLDVVGVFN